MTIRSTALAFFAIGALAVPRAVTAATLPAAHAPAGFATIDGANGGRILEGGVGAQPTAAAAFRAGLARARGSFAGRVRLLGVVRSTDGTMTLGLFTATSGGLPVGGLLLATYVARGASRVDVLYDRAGDVDRSLGAMLRQVAARHPAPAGGPAVAVRDVASPDGSVHAVLPADWRPVVFAQGAFSAVGPDRAEVDQEVAISCVDPRSPIANSGVGIAVPYTRDVTQAYLAVLAALASRGATVPRDVAFSGVTPARGPAGGSVVAVEGTETVAGERHRFQGQLFVSAVRPSGVWMLSIKMVSAPVDRFRADFPLMSAIYDSYNVDQGVRARQVAETIREDEAGMRRASNLMAATRERDTATFDASMGHARAVQRSVDRSTSGFVHYLNDTTVLEGPGGARGSADAGFAQSVVNGDPQNFRIVPVSEYGSGD